MAHQAPIGIFDSGIGGLTVLRALRERLPEESFIYFGDTARVPYGVKSPDTVIRYSVRISEYLQTAGVKLLVVACNTASAHALAALQAHSPHLPVVGVVEPGARAARAVSRSRRIAVLATEGTIRSGAYRKALEEQGSVEVVDRACPLFVPLAEEGWTDDEVTFMVADRYLAEVRGAGVDTAILGCTHYPLLKTAIARALGETIALVDSAVTTADAVARRLAELELEAPAESRGTTRFLLTDVAGRFGAIGERFLGEPLERIELVDL